MRSSSATAITSPTSLLLSGDAMGRMKDAWTFREAYDILQQAKAILLAMEEQGHICLREYGYPIDAIRDAYWYIDDRLSELQREE